MHSLSHLVSRCSLAALALLLALPATASSLAEVKERGKLIMLSVPHQESAFVRTNIERGPMKRRGSAEDFLGVDVEVLRAFAAELGVELEIRPAVGEDGLPSYTELFNALERGDGDVIASSITVTEARSKRADFSRPYHRVHPMVVVRQQSPIRSMSDLSAPNATATAAIVRGSSQEEHLRRLGFEDERLAFQDFSLAAYDAVLEEEADFTLADSSSAQRFVERYDELRIAFEFPDTDAYAYAVEPGSDLLAALDAFLLRLEESGELERIKGKYLSGAKSRS